MSKKAEISLLKQTTIAQILGLADKEYKVTMIKMLNNLVKNKNQTDNINERLGNLSRERKRKITKRKNTQEVLELNNTNPGFYGFYG